MLYAVFKGTFVVLSIVLFFSIIFIIINITDVMPELNYDTCDIILEPSNVSVLPNKPEIISHFMGDNLDKADLSKDMAELSVSDKPTPSGLAYDSPGNPEYQFRKIRNNLGNISDKWGRSELESRLKNLEKRNDICSELKNLLKDNDSKGITNSDGGIGLDVPYSMSENDYNKLSDKVFGLDAEYATASEICDEKAAAFDKKIAASKKEVGPLRKSLLDKSEHGFAKSTKERLNFAEDKVHKKYDDLWEKE